METESREANIQAGETKKRSHIWCGLGNILSDLWRHLSLTFGLIFYTKVVGFSSFQAGLLMAAAQISGLFSTAIFGYLCDSVDVPCISRRLGRKKTWHLASTVFLAFFLLMAFNDCLACNDAATSWVKFAYFAIACSGAAFMFGAGELTHLSILPAMSEDRDDCVALNSLRTGFSFVAGISVYIVAWIVLGQSSPNSLTPSNWKDFMIISAILTGIGLLSAAMFQMGTKEPRKREGRHLHTIFNYDGLVSVAIVFGLAVKDPPLAGIGRKKSKSGGTPLCWTILSYLVPFDVPDRPSVRNEEDNSNEEEGSSEVSGQSRVREGSKYLMPYDVDLIVGPLETLVICSRKPDANHNGEGVSLGVSCKPSSEDKKSSVFGRMFRFFFGLSYDQCDGHEVYVDTEVGCMSTSSTLTSIVSYDDSSDSFARGTTAHSSAIIDHGRHAIDVIQEEEEEEGEGDEGDERGQSTNDKENKPDDDKETKSGDDRKQKKVSFESAPINSTENDMLRTEDSPNDVKKEKLKSIKTWRRWLKEPNLYKVSFIYVSVRLMETITYGYLALYLSDYLHFKKEAIANISLALFVSFLFGTLMTKLLIKLAGAKWTFVFASAVATGSAVWLYFLDGTPASNVYLSVFLCACGMSGMTVSALFFVTIVIYSRKQSSGFVSAFIIIMLKLITACYFVVAQVFYPSDGQGSGTYIRHLYPVSLGVASLLSAFVVICFLRGHASPHEARDPVSTGRRNQVPKTRADPRPRSPRRTVLMPSDLRFSL